MLLLLLLLLLQRLLLVVLWLQWLLLLLSGRVRRHDLLLIGRLGLLDKRGRSLLVLLLLWLVLLLLLILLLLLASTILIQMRQPALPTLLLLFHPSCYRYFHEEFQGTFQDGLQILCCMGGSCSGDASIKVNEHSPISRGFPFELLF